MSSIIVPTVTAFEPHEFREQIEQIAPFATKVHIDLMDGILAPSRSPQPDQVWWPHYMQADIHLMYQKPMKQLDALLKLNPRLVIIHAEADVNHALFASKLNDAGIMAGISLLQNTGVEDIAPLLESFDHVLVFSGSLGYHGGKADLSLLEKVSELKKLKSKLEIGWDGGISEDNIQELSSGGVDVLNVGGYIQKSSNPQTAYDTLIAKLENNK